jgi:uncharacterized membrane protein YfcA
MAILFYIFVFSPRGFVMSLNLMNSILIKAGIFSLFLVWAVHVTRVRYGDKLTWKKSVLIVIVSVLITSLVGGVVSMLLIAFLQHWISEETLETIVLIVTIIVMYVTFRYLQKYSESRFLRSNPSNDD